MGEEASEEGCRVVWEERARLEAAPDPRRSPVAWLGRDTPSQRNGRQQPCGRQSEDGAVRDAPRRQDANPPKMALASTRRPMAKEEGAEEEEAMSCRPVWDGDDGEERRRRDGEDDDEDGDATTAKNHDDDEEVAGSAQRATAPKMRRGDGDACDDDEAQRKWPGAGRRWWRQPP